MLRLLILILLFPGPDLVAQLLLGFLELLSFTTKLGHCGFQLLNLDVLDLGILLRC